LGFFKNLFSSSKEVWQQFANEIGGEYIDSGFWKSKKVVAKLENWIIVLDTFTTSSGKHSTTYTRIRAPFKTLDGLKFNINRKGVFNSIGKAIGIQDIETGHINFDEEFVIKGNDEDKIRGIFSIKEIRDAIRNQDRISLKIKDDEGLFSTNLSEGNYELYFQSTGVIKDIDRLKNLFMIFYLILNALHLVDSASKDEVDIKLK